MDFEALARLIAHELRKNKELLYSRELQMQRVDFPDKAAFWLNRAIQCLANAAATTTHKRFPVERYELIIDKSHGAKGYFSEKRLMEDFFWRDGESTLIRKIFDGDRNCFVDCASAWCAINDPNDGGYYRPGGAQRI